MISTMKDSYSKLGHAEWVLERYASKQDVFILLTMLCSISSFITRPLKTQKRALIFRLR